MSLQKGNSLEEVPLANAPSVAVGTVTTLTPGSQATVTNVGTEQNAILNIGIPQGATGGTGPQGNSGANAANPNFSVGTVSSLAPGSTPTVSIGGSYPNLVLDFGLTRGDTGSGSTVAWGDVSGSLSAQADLAAALAAKADDTDLANYLTTAAAASAYAPLDSPPFTGNPTCPTASAGDNDTSIANTGFVHNELTSYAKLDAPATHQRPQSSTAA
jgi:hypothetical protein